MRDTLTLLIAGILTAIGLLHAYWACGGRLSISSAVPQIGGISAFTPSGAATWAVAAALIGAALTVAAAGDIFTPPVPRWTYDCVAILLALVFAARAIGDFGLVGFFKSRGDGAFARLDTWVYSPLCLIIAAGIAAIVIIPGDSA